MPLISYHEFHAILVCNYLSLRTVASIRVRVKRENGIAEEGKGGKAEKRKRRRSGKKGKRRESGKKGESGKAEKRVKGGKGEKRVKGGKG